VTIGISGAHGDALYELLMDRLSGIGDVWAAVMAEDFDTATRLGWEYSDALRLILEDLGWGAERDLSIELSAPPDVLRRVFARLQETAASQREFEALDWADARDREERNRLVAEACKTVLGGLEDE
jgi:hypothetical protein